MKKNVVQCNIKRRFRKLKRKKNKISRKQIMSTKVSTVSPWTRSATNIIGALIMYIGFLSNHSIFLYIVGIVILYVGIFGNKKTVESTLDELCSSGVECTIEGILDGIIN